MSDDDSNCDDCITIPTAPDFSTRQPTVTAQLNTAFEALADSCCRCILYHLHSMQGEVAERVELVQTVQDFIKADGDTGGGTNAETAMCSLHHQVLPRLQEAGYIEYDSRSGTVRYHDSPALNDWLEQAFHKEIDGAT